MYVFFFLFRFALLWKSKAPASEGNIKLAPPFPEDADFRENAVEIAPSRWICHALFLAFFELVLIV